MHTQEEQGQKEKDSPELVLENGDDFLLLFNDQFCFLNLACTCLINKFKK